MAVTTNHIQHLEDWVFTDNKPYLTVVKIIKGILSQERGWDSLSYKIDGAPSFVTGTDTVWFFVATKSWHKANKRCYSVEDITMHFGHKPAVATKLRQLYEWLYNEAWQAGKVYQWEFLFGQWDLMTHDSGVTWYRPNTLIYSFQEDHADYQRFTQSKLWVVLHTEYDCDETWELVRVPNPQIPDIHNPDVWTNTTTPQYQLSSDQESTLTQLQEVSKLTSAWWSHHGSQLVAWMKNYRPGYKHAEFQKRINTQIREHDWPISSYRKMIESYRARFTTQVETYWFKQLTSIQDKITTRTDKKQTPKTIKELQELQISLEKTTQKKNQSHYAISYSDHIISHWLQAWVTTQSIKNEVIDILNEATSWHLWYNYYYPTEQLTQSKGWEWYVYTHDGIDKLVTRHEFSRNNFVIAKKRISLNHKPIWIMYGRFNPLTRWHQYNAMKAKQDAHLLGIPFVLYITRTHNSDTDPVSPELKLKLAQEALPGCDVRLVYKSTPTIMWVISSCGSEWYSHVTLISWSDASSWKEELEQYDFDGVAIDTQVYGDTRTQLSQALESETDMSIASISGTRVRKVARDQQWRHFVQMMPTWVSRATLSEIYRAIKKSNTR